MSRPPDPRGKISVAFLEFCRPLVEILPPGAGPAELEVACRTPWLVWNAVVLEALGRPSSYLAQARELIRTGSEGAERDWMLALVDVLEARKRSERPPDLRVIGEVEAFVDGSGELRLRVSHVAPP